MTSLRFPPGFAWGAATAAYQIEGAATEDGKGPSVWDTFSHTPGNVFRDDTGDVACDAYHRYASDVDLLAGLGLSTYRFSISWPRLKPSGTGQLNQRGADYYRRLIDALVDRGIAPAVTLYHWDLPQELQDLGGWASREVAYRFADYAALAADVLGVSDVARWITLNEPQVVVDNGYRTRRHAPGLDDNEAARAATHHLLLGHGLAMQALRAAGAREAGITLDLHPVRPLGDGLGLDQAARFIDAELNALYLEPLLNGSYPAEASDAVLPPAQLIEDGDLAVISEPIDFLGVNYYAPIFIRPGDATDLRRHESPVRGNMPGVVGYRPPSLPVTPMGWLVDPEGLYELLLRLTKDAPGISLYVTENGCAADDYVSPEGVVNDTERISYLHKHLDAAARAVRDGANLAGYYVWSLLDNFEWGWGYSKRFGIVYVDFATQQRIPKASARFYAQVAADNAVPPLPVS